MSLSLNGASQQYGQYTGTVFGNVPIGMFAWGKLANVTDTHSLIGSGGATNTAQYFLLQAAGATAGDPARWARAGGSLGQADSSTSYNANQWHAFGGLSVAAAIHGASLDGAGIGTDTVSAGSFNNTMTKVFVGAANRATLQFPTTGLIADAAIWNLTGWGGNATVRRSMFEAACLAMFNGARPTDFPVGLLNYYPLGSDALDYSTNGNHLTLFNSPSYSGDNPTYTATGPTYSTITDDFNRADNATSAGTAAAGWSWSNMNGTWGIGSNQIYNAAIGTTGGNTTRAEADLTSADHYVQARLSTLNQTGVCARMSAAQQSFYHLRRSQNTQLTLFRCETTTYNTLTTFTVPAMSAGDMLRLEVSGTANVLLEAKINGASVGTFTDSSATRIALGTRTGLRAAGQGTNNAVDDFEAGVLTPASVGFSFLPDWW